MAAAHPCAHVALQYSHAERKEIVIANVWFLLKHSNDDRPNAIDVASCHLISLVCEASVKAGGLIIYTNNKELGRVSWDKQPPTTTNNKT